MMSERHLRAVAAELGPEWERLASDLGFTLSELYRLKQDGSTTENTIFSMLVVWSRREGGDLVSKVKTLGEALDECGRRDVVQTVLEPYVYV